MVSKYAINLEIAYPHKDDDMYTKYEYRGGALCGGLVIIFYALMLIVFEPFRILKRFFSIGG